MVGKFFTEKNSSSAIYEAKYGNMWASWEVVIKWNNLFIEQPSLEKFYVRTIFRAPPRLFCFARFAPFLRKKKVRETKIEKSVFVSDGRKKSFSTEILKKSFSRPKILTFFVEQLFLNFGFKFRTQPLVLYLLWKNLTQTILTVVNFLCL